MIYKFDVQFPTPDYQPSYILCLGIWILSLSMIFSSLFFCLCIAVMVLQLLVLILVVKLYHKFDPHYTALDHKDNNDQKPKRFLQI